MLRKNPAINPKCGRIKWCEMREKKTRLFSQQIRVANFLLAVLMWTKVALTLAECNKCSTPSATVQCDRPVISKLWKFIWILGNSFAWPPRCTQFIFVFEEWVIGREQQVIWPDSVHWVATSRANSDFQSCQSVWLQKLLSCSLSGSQPHKDISNINATSKLNQWNDWGWMSVQFHRFAAICTRANNQSIELPHHSAPHNSHTPTAAQKSHSRVRCTAFPVRRWKRRLLITKRFSHISCSSNCGVSVCKIVGK